MTLSLCIQLWMRPYKGPDLNNVEILGLSVGGISLYLGLWTLDNNDRTNIAVSVLVILLNSFWALYVLVMLFRKYKVAQLLISLGNFICRRKASSSFEGVGVGVAEETESKVLTSKSSTTNVVEMTIVGIKDHDCQEVVNPLTEAHIISSQGGTRWLRK